MLHFRHPFGGSQRTASPVKRASRASRMLKVVLAEPVADFPPYRVALHRASSGIGRLLQDHRAMTRLSRPLRRGGPARRRGRSPPCLATRTIPGVIAGRKPGRHLTDLRRPLRRIRAPAGPKDARIHDRATAPPRERWRRARYAVRASAPNIPDSIGVDIPTGESGQDAAQGNSARREPRTHTCRPRCVRGRYPKPADGERCFLRRFTARDIRLH